MFINSLSQYFERRVCDYMPDFVRGTGDSGGKEANVNYSFTGGWHWIDTLYCMM